MPQTTTIEATGWLARTYGRKRLPLKVCRSAAGFYLGTYDDGQPYSRESAEYWPSLESAEAALASGNWTQRPNP